jgi:hypothetical protein
MCAPPHRNSIGKSTLSYKGVIKIGKPKPGSAFVTNLYFLLMYRNRDSHRFFIFQNLFEGSLRNPIEREHTMFDFVLLAMGIGFFALAIGYAYACDRL